MMGWAAVGGGCCCFITIAVLVGIAVLLQQVGSYFVYKHVHWASNITVCETDKGEFSEPSIIGTYMLGNTPQFKCMEGQGHMLTPNNLTHYLGWPNCTAPGLVHEMSAFNKKRKWKLVEFPSRRGHHGQEKLRLKAWWLPADDPTAPRIIVQHGNNANFNSRFPWTAAYFLRSIGFSCLLPNLRDHGISEETDHDSIGYGYDYHLDLLGAWDYAVHDPDKLLNGRMHMDNVGIMGFSMGAFITSNAFGIEPKVPGAWIDSGPFEPIDLLYYSIQGTFGGASPLFIGPTYFFAKAKSGVDLSLWTPSKALPGNADEKRKRPIAVVHGQQDTVVPATESDQLLELVRSLPELYELKEEYLPQNAYCGGGDHLTAILVFPQSYRQKLCDFWTGVFKMKGSACGIDKLPNFPDVDDEIDEQGARSHRHETHGEKETGKVTKLFEAGRVISAEMQHGLVSIIGLAGIAFATLGAAVALVSRCRRTPAPFVPLSSVEHPLAHNNLVTHC